MKPELFTVLPRMLPRTIRWKILLLFGTGATLLFLLIFITGQFGLPFKIYQGNYHRLENEAINRLNAIADNEKDLISIWFNERLTALKFSAHEPHFKSHLHDLAATGQKHKKTETVLYELLEWFLLAKKNYNYEAIELLESRTGITLFSTRQEQQGKKSLLLDKLFADGSDWEEKVFLQMLGNTPLICLAYQIQQLKKDGSKNPDSLVMIYLIRTEQFIDDVIRNYTILGQSGEVVLIDLEQTIIAPLKYKLPDGADAKPLEYRLQTKMAEFASWGVDGIQKAPDYRGVPVVAAIRNFRVTADFGLGIIVKQDEAEIFSSLKESNFHMVFLTVTGLTSLLAMLYMVTRNMLKPLEKLTSSVRKIKHGELDTREVTGNSEETRTLTIAFNEMAEEIQRWHRGFEVAVKGRTEELSKYSEVVEQSPVSIVITDIQGNIEFVNPKFLSMTGYSIEELLGQNPRLLKSGETPPETYQELWRTISSGRIWEGELTNKKKSGELFWEQAKISPIKNIDGIITGYVGIKEDITEKRQMEAQLLQSQKMEAMGSLAGGIAHDFNNILTVIAGYGTILRMKLEKDPSALAMIEEILAAEGRAEVMTRSLLAFSRKEEIRLAPDNLTEILRGLEKSLSRLIREDIDFKIELPASCLPIMADKGQLEQLVVNLVVNARDALPSGGRLNLSLAERRLTESDILADNQLLQGRYAVITVADNGIGMDKQTRERIFDPFFTTKEVGKGTGLGLSMAYSIVKKHGGSIHLRSEPGEGTIFEIYLPLLEQPLESIAVAEEAPLVSGSETILFVEDDPAIRKIVTTFLTEQGYRLLTAENGAEGVEVFRNNQDAINLILSDVIMPKKNGKEMYQDICRIKADIPIIFMTGYTDNILDNNEFNTGNLLFKPIQPLTLQAKIREVLDGKTTRGRG